MATGKVGWGGFAAILLFFFFFLKHDFKADGEIADGFLEINIFFPSVLEIFIQQFSYTIYLD